MKRSAFVLLLAASALLLTGCFPGTGPGTTPAPSDPSRSSAPSTAASPSAETTGDCTAGPAGNDRATPIVYTVFGPADGQPVTVAFTSFNTDGTLPVTTVTFTGPVFTRVGYACSTASDSAIWTLTATSVTTGAVGCVLDFGGQLVQTDSAFLETGTPTATTATCSGNPGQ